jgi:hypothetical protein
MNHFSTILKRTGLKRGFIVTVKLPPAFYGPKTYETTLFKNGLFTTTRFHSRKKALSHHASLI